MTKGSGRRPRILYLAPVHHEPPATVVGSAARNKVLGICEALATAGVRPIVLSTAPPGRERRRIRRAGATIFVETPAWGRRGLRRMSAMLGYVATVLRHVRSPDAVILYNYFPEYLALALLLRLRGTPATLDVEDGPSIGNWPPNRFFNRLFWALTLPLVASGKLVVAEKLADRLGLRRRLAVYGVAGDRPAAPPTPRCTATRIRVNFGGTINPETGLELFRRTLRWLASNAPDAPLSFVVTGRVEATAFADLEPVIAATPGLTLERHDDLSLVDYRTLLDGCDVGLSLRIPGEEIAETTFPSKVIEIAGAGLLLVTTRISDIPVVFDENNAVLLSDASPETLARAFLEIVADRARARDRAKAGQALIEQRFSREACGRAIATFIGMRQ